MGPKGPEYLCYATAHPRTPLLTPIPHCSPSYPTAHPHTPLLTLIPHCSPSYPTAHPHTPTAHPHTPLLILIPHCSPSYPTAHPHAPLLTLIPHCSTPYPCRFRPCLRPKNSISPWDFKCLQFIFDKASMKLKRENIERCEFALDFSTKC